MSVDILGTSWDQCQSMVQYSFTSTETRRLVRTDRPGRPPRLSHSSWTMIRLDSNDFGFIWAGVSNMVRCKKTSDIVWVVCNKLTTVWAPTKKMFGSWQLYGTYGVTKYGSGWRKDVVNQCLEFVKYMSKTYSQVLNIPAEQSVSTFSRTWHVFL